MSHGPPEENHGTAGSPAQPVVLLILSSSVHSAAEMAAKYKHAVLSNPSRHPAIVM
jgi:hypothetical protein